MWYTAVYSGDRDKDHYAEVKLRVRVRNFSAASLHRWSYFFCPMPSLNSVRCGERRWQTMPSFRGHTHLPQSGPAKIRSFTNSGLTLTKEINKTTKAGRGEETAVQSSAGSSALLSSAISSLDHIRKPRSDRPCQNCYLVNSLVWPNGLDRACDV